MQLVKKSGQGTLWEGQVREPCGKQKQGIDRGRLIGGCWLTNRGVLLLQVKKELVCKSRASNMVD